MGTISSRFGNLSPLKQALLAIEELQQKLAGSERRFQEPVAIIGMACRFPGAPDAAAYWRLLDKGEDAVTETPPSRWRIEDYYDPGLETPGKMSTRWGGYLDGIDQFDPEFFGISPREAANMDPQQRLLLEVAWEALENAGQGPRDLVKRRTGVFVGIVSDDYAQLFHRAGDLSVFNAYFASGVARSVAGGRISYALGLQGPNISLDTACSSSLVAIHTACLYLRSGECRMALAGGANALLSPEFNIAFSKARMMAPDGRSKAFDARADGFVRGEGCGLVVLKRLPDAQADGDSILAVIRGSAVNQDGRSSGLTVPNLAAQESVIRQALAAGGLKPHEIDYVEAHGTGTPLGDPIEARALASTLGPGRGSDHPLVVGSVKTNIGHLESAAGIAGLIKTVLALQRERIPRHLHFEKMNPHIDWNGMPVEIPVNGRPWPRGERRRLAGVSAFGFSGTNAHVIVEEPPARESARRPVERPRHILTLSARSEEALAKLAAAYAEALARRDADLADIAFTANAGRAHFERRLAVTGSSREELRRGLLDASGERVRDRDGVRPVFVFPAGDAPAGMAPELYETNPVFRAAMEECGTPASAPAALFALEYALAQLWRGWGIQPAAVVGAGAGEIAAACVSGMLPLADALKLAAAWDRGAAAFEEALRAARVQAPLIQALSGATGRQLRIEDLRPADGGQLAPGVEALTAKGQRVFVALGAASIPTLPRECVFAPSLRDGRGAWEQMLETLALLYMRGADVDWAEFDAPYHRSRVPLPTYPFERRRYWLENPACYPKPPRVESEAHPLLGRRVEIAGDSEAHVWEKRISLERLPYLADHRAFGNPVFPLTGYLEMISAALGGSEPGPRAIEDVVILEPLALTPGEETVVQLSIRAGAIQIHSRQPLGWKLCATARHGAPAAPPAGVSLAQTAPQVGADFDPESFYAMASRRGMDFGPAFRTIREIRSGPREAVAKVASVEARDYWLHPAAFDGCLQILGAALPETGLYMPFALGRAEFFRPAAGELWSHCVLRKGGGANLTFDFDIHDARGPVARLTGMEMRRAEGAQKPAAGRTVAYFEPKWEPKTWGLRAGDAAGDWLLVAAGELADAFAAEIAALKGRATVVRDPSAMGAGGKQWRGVVYIPGECAAQSPEGAQERICGAALDLVHALAGQAGTPPRLWIVTRGAQMASAGQSRVSLAQSTLWGMTQAISDEYPEWRPALIDLDPDAAPDAAALIREMLGDDFEEHVAFRNGERLVERYRPRASGPSPAPLRLTIKGRGILDNLQVEPAERRPAPRGSVEIQVDATALNFRDVLSALGMYPGDAGPLGSECAGPIVALGAGVEGWSEGDEVIAFTGGAHDGFVAADARMVARRPANLTASQAAAIPTAFLTARYALETLARIRPGDRILIHAGTGGVGMAAIQVAQRARAEIFATAGSERKRELLRSMGVRHVMDSRTLDFAARILQETGGRGVDIVLNSLAGEFIPASFSTIAENGRFIEIGKRGIWTAEQVRALGRNIDYRILDLGEVAARDPEGVGALLRDTAGAIERGELKPLPVTVFAFREAASAYRTMAQAQHTGKLVLRQDGAGARIARNATYLVTGAFGGVGLPLIEWLVENGARNLALTGRRAPSTDAQAVIRRLEANGAQVRVFPADVAREDAMERVLAEIRGQMPPLRGILHAAGALDDGTLAQQTWERFETPLRPKVYGSCVLHRLTAGDPLDFFLMFSSTAAVLGAPGLANYAAANAFQDALAHERRRLGLPAVSVNWGTWGVGMALVGGMEERRRAAGITAMTGAEALGALRRILLDSPPQIGAGLFDWNRFVGRDRGRPAPKRFSTLLDARGPERARQSAPAKPAEPASGGPAALRAQIESLALRVLGFPPDRRIDPLQPLNELGLDSLMAVEFRNALAAAVGRNLPATLLFSYPALEDLATFLTRELSGEAPPEPAPAAQPAGVLSSIEDLSDEEVERLYAQRMGGAH
jgi:acyl transferase domain-containing protein/acyl carrier protein